MYLQIPIKKCNTTSWYGPPLYSHSESDDASQIEYKCSPIAFDVGTTAPVMMLFPVIKLPATGSRILSISTAGAAIKAIMNTVVAVNKVGIMITLLHPI
jgi:hypothetical protein